MVKFLCFQANSFCHPPLLENTEEHGRKPVDIEARGEVIEQHREDDGHDVAHEPLLFLLVGHQFRIFRGCCRHPLLEKHDSSKKKGEEVE